MVFNKPYITSSYHHPQLKHKLQMGGSRSKLINSQQQVAAWCMHPAQWAMLGSRCQAGKVERNSVEGHAQTFELWHLCNLIQP